MRWSWQPRELDALLVPGTELHGTVNLLINKDAERVNHMAGHRSRRSHVDYARVNPAWP